MSVVSGAKVLVPPYGGRLSQTLMSCVLARLHETGCQELTLETACALTAAHPSSVLECRAEAEHFRNSHRRATLQCQTIVAIPCRAPNRTGSLRVAWTHGKPCAALATRAQFLRRSPNSACKEDVAWPKIISELTRCMSLSRVRAASSSAKSNRLPLCACIRQALPLVL